MTALADLAVELRLAATREAFGVEALEWLAARSGEALFEAGLREARLSARLMGEAHALIKALIPHEAAIRALLASSELQASARDRAA